MHGRGRSKLKDRTVAKAQGGQVVLAPAFFAHLLPQMGIEELLVTLYFLHLSQGEGEMKEEELVGNPLLLRALARHSSRPAQAALAGLAQALRRGTLKRKEGEKGVIVSGAPLAPISNIYRLYEENVGPLSPLVAEELRLAEARYPWPWIAAAFREAVEHNKRSWSYIKAILRRWEEEGIDEAPRRSSGLDEVRWLEERYRRGKGGAARPS